MKRKCLIDTNPFLRDPAVREEGLILNVATSSSIEGIPMSVCGFLAKKGKVAGFKVRRASAKSARSVRRKSSS